MNKIYDKISYLMTVLFLLMIPMHILILIFDCNNEALMSLIECWLCIHYLNSKWVGFPWEKGDIHIKAAVSDYRSKEELVRDVSKQIVEQI